MDDDPEEPGVDFDVVCGDVPVLKLNKKATTPQGHFRENASWMLQEATGSTASVKTLYEDCRDPDIHEALESQLGLEKGEGWPVRLKNNPTVRGVGIGGQRAAVLALTVAQVLRNPTEGPGLFPELSRHGLKKDFITIIRKIKGFIEEDRRGAQGEAIGDAYQSSPSEEEEEEEYREEDGHAQGIAPLSREELVQGVPTPDESPATAGDLDEEQGPSERIELLDSGVDLIFVRGDIPIVGLDKASGFHEFASWLLQTALGWSGKADAIFTYDDDEDIIQACKDTGLTANEIAIAKVKQQPWTGLRAVGTSGKRSIMFALVIAAVVRGEVNMAKVRRELVGFCDRLDEPLCELFRRVSQVLGLSIADIEPKALRRTNPEPPAKRRRETYGRGGMPEIMDR